MARPRSGPVDEIAVELVVKYGHVAADLNREERREAVALLTARGLSAAQIAERIGLTQRTVVRYRSALRQEAA